jgi:hypothetical protein
MKDMDNKTIRASLKLFWGAAATILVAAPLLAAALPSEWRQVQTFELKSPGLVKISLPTGTLDAARPGLEDLRLYDGAGNEVPYLITRPAPTGRMEWNAKSFQAALQPAATVITLETGRTQAVDGVTLETPNPQFIKAVRVEGLADGQRWQPLAEGRPIFRQTGAAAQLHVPFPAGAWNWLRLTVDDRRMQPVPFTGARIHAAAPEATPSEWQPATVVERNENPGETRLTLDLGAANLDVAQVQIETDEPLFTRAVSLLVPQLGEDAIGERNAGGGVIYRVAVDGASPAASLGVPLEAQIPTRELVVVIHNEDSPPLPVKAVRIERRPVQLLFLARQGGTFSLLTGNKTCAAPRYDLAALAADLKGARETATAITSPAANPAYRPPEALAGLAVTGTGLDLSGWKYRKAIRTTWGGVQQVELDPELLANSTPADLRVMRGSNQVPFILQRASISRTLAPSVTFTNEAKRPSSSRWLIKLPQSGLPISRLTCTSRTPLFQRSLTLSEEIADERGDTYRHWLGNAVWTQTPERKAREFSLQFEGTMRGDTLILETENGDNPPVELEQFKLHYPVTRLLFKAQPNDELFLYYGNPRVAAPRYDVSLVAGELLVADKGIAGLGPEERLQKPSWGEGAVAGKVGWLFWGILAVVVVGLLTVIGRLLPKAAES